MVSFQFNINLQLTSVKHPSTKPFCSHRHQDDTFLETHPFLFRGVWQNETNRPRTTTPFSLDVNRMSFLSVNLRAWSMWTLRPEETNWASREQIGCDIWRSRLVSSRNTWFTEQLHHTNRRRTCFCSTSIVECSGRQGTSRGISETRPWKQKEQVVVARNIKLSTISFFPYEKTNPMFNTDSIGMYNTRSLAWTFSPQRMRVTFFWSFSEGGGLFISQTTPLLCS